MSATGGSVPGIPGPTGHPPQPGQQTVRPLPGQISAGHQLPQPLPGQIAPLQEQAHPQHTGAIPRVPPDVGPGRALVGQPLPSQVQPGQTRPGPLGPRQQTVRPLPGQVSPGQQLPQPRPTQIAPLQGQGHPQPSAAVPGVTPAAPEHPTPGQPLPGQVQPSQTRPRPLAPREAQQQHEQQIQQQRAQQIQQQALQQRQQQMMQQRQAPGRETPAVDQVSRPASRVRSGVSGRARPLAPTSGVLAVGPWSRAPFFDVVRDGRPLPKFCASTPFVLQ
jgi:hypothetical protein